MTGRRPTVRDNGASAALLAAPLPAAGPLDAASNASGALGGVVD
ncbi:hypothetical protein ACFQZZ_29400 [Nocardia sp. GCM10030253]